MVIRELPKTTTRTVRLLHKCKPCGRVERTETLKRTHWSHYYSRIEAHHTYVNAEGGSVEVRRFCSCGRTMGMQEICGTYRKDKPCNARCMGATGPACECACAGKNHGGSHAI